MDEDFKRKFRPELRQIAQRELAGNNDLFCTEFFGKRDSPSGEVMVIWVET